MKFYNAWYCPFAQRAWMALVYKDIDFDYIEIDPYDFTDSWLRSGFYLQEQ
ncbi:MAG: glutathione S-transferase N-terminal domain-containing protein [Gammaproteobacteria bacterium]